MGRGTLVRYLPNIGKMLSSIASTRKQTTAKRSPNPREDEFWVVNSEGSLLVSEGVAQWIECLPAKHCPVDPYPVPHKADGEARAYDLSTQEVGAGRSSSLTECQTSLGYSLDPVSK